MVAQPSMSAEFVQAAHTSSGSNLPITRIVIHGTVSKTFVGGARATAGYFASQGSGGSAHYIVDPATVVQSVAEATVAWHAPPNSHSLGIEMCDLVDYSEAAKYDSARFPNEAAWNARWDRPEFDAMLRLTADLTIELAAKYGVPLVKLSASDLLAGRHGICGHIDVSQAWHQTDHHDPGTTFPWGRFMDYLANPGKTLTAAAPTPETAPAPAPIVIALKESQMLVVEYDNTQYDVNLSTRTYQKIPGGVVTSRVASELSGRSTVVLKDGDEWTAFNALIKPAAATS